LEHGPSSRHQLFFDSLLDDRYGIQLVLDESGAVIAASRAPPGGGLNFAHRDYFTVHLQRPDVGLYIGAPFLSEYDGEPSVPMSRRWNKPDGSFGGVVVQTIKLSVPNGLFSSFELGRDSGVYILLTDGTILTRFPLASADIGASIARTEGYRYFVAAREGSFIGVGGLEPVESLHVYRTLDNFPVVVSVFQSRDSILSDWERNALWLATG